MTRTTQEPRRPGRPAACMRRTALLWTFALCAIVAVSGRPAQAQRELEPGQIERRIDLPKTVRPQPAPDLPTESQKPPSAVPQMPAFVLVGMNIEGATVFEPGAFGSIYEPYLGQRVTGRDIDAILDAITRKYRDAGYILSRAVASDERPSLGVVNVRIIEGYVAKVAFEGDTPGYRSLLEDYGAKIKASRPLRLADLERYLLLINDLPGVATRPRLTEIDPLDGGYELTVAIGFRPVQPFFGLDNRGTDDSGPLQALAGADFNSIFGLYEQTRIFAFTVPDDPNELIYASIFNEHRIGAEGTRMLLSGSYSRVDTNSGTIKTDGQGHRLSAGVSHPVVRRRDFSLVVSSGFDAIRSKQASNGTGFDDRLRVVRLGTRLQVIDGWRGDNGFGLEVSRGLDILNASDPDKDQPSRAGAEVEFTKLVLDVQRFQPIGRDWFALLGGAAQWSPDILFSAEEFSLGSTRFGRGYDPSELTASRGVGGVFEFGYRPRTGMEFLPSFQIYGFGDGGAVWFDDDTSQGLASAGGGIRLELVKGLTAQVEMAKPLIRDVAQEGDRDWRLFFSVSGALGPPEVRRDR